MIAEPRSAANSRYLERARMRMKLTIQTTRETRNITTKLPPESRSRLPPPPKNGRNLHQYLGNGREECGYGYDHHVPVLHMRQFMCQHRFQLASVELLHDACGHGHHGILLVSARSKSVRHAGIYYGNPRHGQTGNGAKPGYYLVKLGSLALRDYLGAHGHQDHLVRIEILQEHEPAHEQDYYSTAGIHGQ